MRRARIHSSRARGRIRNRLQGVRFLDPGPWDRMHEVVQGVAPTYSIPLLKGAECCPVPISTFVCVLITVNIESSDNFSFVCLVEDLEHCKNDCIDLTKHYKKLSVSIKLISQLMLSEYRNSRKRFYSIPSIQKKNYKSTVKHPNSVINFERRRKKNHYTLTLSKSMNIHSGVKAHFDPSVS